MIFPTALMKPLEAFYDADNCGSGEDMDQAAFNLIDVARKDTAVARFIAEQLLAVWMAQP